MVIPMKKYYNFYAVNRATGERTKLEDTNSIVLELEDGQEFELSAYLSGEVKIESSVALSLRPDTMSSMVINDNPNPELDPNLVRSCRAFKAAKRIMKKKYDHDLEELYTESEYINRFSGQDPEGVVAHIAAKNDMLRVMPKLTPLGENLFNTSDLKTEK